MADEDPAKTPLAKKLAIGTLAAVGFSTTLLLGYWSFLPGPLSVNVPEITLTNESGQATRLQLTNRDRHLVVFVTSSRCPYCKANFANWANLVARTQDIAVDYRLVSLDDPQSTRLAVQGEGLDDIPILFGDLELFDIAGSTMIPLTIAFPAGSSTLVRQPGVLTETALKSIEAALGIE